MKTLKYFRINVGAAHRYIFYGAAIVSLHRDDGDLEVGELKGHVSAAHHTVFTRGIHARHTCASYRIIDTLVRRSGINV